MITKAAVSTSLIISLMFVSSLHWSKDMSTDFVRQPLLEHLNRNNPITRILNLESNAIRPSASVVQLSQISSDAGDQIAGTYYVYDANTGQMRGYLTAYPKPEAPGYHLAFFNSSGVFQFGVSADDGSAIAGAGAVELDADGITLSVPSSYEPSSSVKWKNGSDLGFELYSIITGSRIEAYVQTVPIDSVDARLSILSNVPAAGTTPELVLATQKNGVVQASIYFDNDSIQVNGNITNGTGLAHGTWTPTTTNGTNVTSSTDIVPGSFNYMRIGNQVSFNGILQIDTTAAGAFVVYLSLPIASDFTGGGDANGSGVNPTAAASTISIREDTVGDRLQLEGYAQVATNLFYRVSGGYIVK